MKLVIKQIVQRNHTAIQVILWSLVAIIFTAVALSVELMPGDISLVVYSIVTTVLLLLGFGLIRLALEAGVIYKSVLIQKKSDWQKDECLFCDDPADFEARYKYAYIRCCNKEECQRSAKKLALEIGKYKV